MSFTIAFLGTLVFVILGLVIPFKFVAKAKQVGSFNENEAKLYLRKLSAVGMVGSLSIGLLFFTRQNFLVVTILVLAFGLFSAKILRYYGRKSISLLEEELNLNENGDSLSK